MNFKFIDLFAGIGGFHIAFEDAGGECVFASEWDKFAQETYESNFGIKPQGDIQKISSEDIPDHDMLLGGFPCQPFSIAGVSKKNSLGRKHGFDDVKQGNLFFDIARIIETKRPKAFVLENVKNLESHDKGNTFKVIRQTLSRLGYGVFYTILDAQDFGVPQHRERIFIVGFDKEVFPGIYFEFPKTLNKNPKIKNILDKTVDEKYTLSDKMWNYLQEYKKKHQRKGNGFGYGLIDPEKDSITRTLSARYYKDGSEILIKQKGKNPRRLTPRECARLQGFPESFTIPVSDTQAYKQFGNAVAVPVVRAVAENVLHAIENYDGPVLQRITEIELEQLSIVQYSV